MFREGGMHPSRAAQIILKGVKNKQSRIFVGLDAKLLDLSQRLFPRHYHKTWPVFMPLIMLFRNKKALATEDQLVWPRKITHCRLRCRHLTACRWRNKPPRHRYSTPTQTTALAVARQLSQPSRPQNRF